MGTAAPTPPRDVRRWIYGGLDVVFAITYALCVAVVIPNRLPSGMLHLWVLPVATAVMAVGTLMGTPTGRRIALAGGAALIAAVVLMILRLVVSAAFLAGVYGAYGKAASSLTLVAVALLVELVGLLPLVQVKWLMSRAGRRAYGV